MWIEVIVSEDQNVVFTLASAFLGYIDAYVTHLGGYGIEAHVLATGSGFKLRCWAG